MSGSFKKASAHLCPAADPGIGAFTSRSFALPQLEQSGHMDAEMEMLGPVTVVMDNWT
jgi:hypothetical protein